MFVCFKGGKFLSHKQVFFDVLSPIIPKTHTLSNDVKFSLFYPPNPQRQLF